MRTSVRNSTGDFGHCWRGRRTEKSELISARRATWLIPLIFWGCTMNRSGMQILQNEIDSGTTSVIDAARDSFDVSVMIWVKDAASGDSGGMGGVKGMGGMAVSDMPASTGGLANTGGRFGTGGIVGSGGVIGTGGLTGQGGFSGTGRGGQTGSGGVKGTGGLTIIFPGTGGMTATGGAGIGGKAGTGGAIGTGGTTTCVLGPFQAPDQIVGLDLDDMDLWGPSISSDGTTLYFAASDAFTEDDIFTATRSDRGLRFSAAVKLESVNTPSADGSPSISSDGLTLYFYSKRPFGRGERDIWSASRTNPQADFGPATLLAAVNGDADDNLQWLSADELTIVFSSTRSGGSDLYLATRSNRGFSFSAPEILHGNINGATREDRAALSNDGLSIYFVSDRTGGQGDKDIWFAKRTSTQGEFGNFTNLQEVNGPQRDIDVALSSDERELFFASKRGASFQLYRSIRNCQ
jgi:hypothetical protein